MKNLAILFVIMLMVGSISRGNYIYGQDNEGNTQAEYLRKEVPLPEQSLSGEVMTGEQKVLPNEEIPEYPIQNASPMQEGSADVSGNRSVVTNFSNMKDETPPQEVPFDYSYELMEIDKTYDFKKANDKLKVFLSIKNEMDNTNRKGPTYFKLLELIELWKKRILKIKALRGY